MKNIEYFEKEIGCKNFTEEIRDKIVQFY
jgi:hypothetical protein